MLFWLAYDLVENAYTVYSLFVLDFCVKVKAITREYILMSSALMYANM